MKNKDSFKEKDHRKLTKNETKDKKQDEGKGNDNTIYEIKNCVSFEVNTKQLLQITILLQKNIKSQSCGEVAFVNGCSFTFKDPL